MIGEIVMDALKDLDEVAYVRFASVYREFKDVNTFMDQIQAYIAEHYAEKLTLTGIASQFYISPYYLSRLFKKSINLSLIEYINGVRVKAAQNLIEKSNESISDIAEKTGFMTTAHFRRVFKDATGLSPQQYRQYYKRVNK